MQNKKSNKNSQKTFTRHEQIPAQSIGVYTVLSTLRKMRQELGFEAMAEYLDKYLQLVEQSNPTLKAAVEKALTIISVEKIYQDAMKD